MNLNVYDFNVPDFVRSAESSCFDPHAAGAVVVGGFRIDNPAAAWVAGAEMRKKASDLDDGIVGMIKQACSLFNISDEMFTVPTMTSNVMISDGEHTAEFNVYDNESLNKAASELLDKRDMFPYPFAHDCAAALLDEARNQRLSFNKDNVVGVRKLAGDYNVDFEAGRKLLDGAVERAEKLGMAEHAEVLKKIANLCTSDSSPELAPYFITALDEFDRAVKDLRKESSADRRRPEDVFYLSTAEYTQKQNEAPVAIAGSTVSSSDVCERRDAISKWASICGYSVPANSSPAQISAAVAKMPAALQDEFVELFV